MITKPDIVIIVDT